MDEKYILILQFNDKRNEWEDVRNECAVLMIAVKPTK